MNAYHLPYSPLGCIILRCVCFFLIFSPKYQQKARWCCRCINKWEEITKSSLWTLKSKLMDTFGSGKSSPFERVDFSIVSYLHFLNLNNILTLPKLRRRWGYVWLNTTYACLVFYLPDLRASALVYEIKANASRLSLSREKEITVRN